METFTWNTQFRNRVRLLAGIEAEELDNDTLDILANMAAEWFQDNTGRWGANYAIDSYEKTAWSSNGDGDNGFIEIEF